MKSKFEQQDIDTELEDDQEAEVDSGGPAIASAKNSKMIIVAASSLLITLVIYFLFFKGAPDQSENLEEVIIQKDAAQVASNEDGKDFFDIEIPEEKDEEIELLKKPDTPEVPTVPELPQGVFDGEDKLDLITEEERNKQTALLPTQENLPTNSALQDTQVGVIGSIKNQAQAKKEPIDPRYAPIIVVDNGSIAPVGEGLGNNSPSRSVGYENNIVKLKQDPFEKLQKTESQVATTLIADRTHTIAQGKLITAVLETAINTEIPGFVRAIVSRDIYGEAGNSILIPRGARLFGAYSSEISKGQGRVQISWTRLIRPDGVDLAISFNASDQFGRSGIKGDVDNKYSSIIATSLLTSILAVGGVAAAEKLIGDNDDTTTTTNPTDGTTTSTGNASGQAVYDVSKTIIDTVGQVISDTINVNPVIRVPQGTRITVIVNADMTVPAVKGR